MADPLVLFDLGDTLMIEETERKDASGITQTADLIPGMERIVRDLARDRVRLGLVADTRIGTYHNVLRQHNLFDLFAHFSISDELGVEKPHPEMFLSALRRTDSSPSDALMVGNYYACDVEGAHACGLATVWFHWNDRRPAPPDPVAATYVATNADEVRAAIDHWLRSRSVPPLAGGAAAGQARRRQSPDPRRPRPPT